MCLQNELQVCVFLPYGRLIGKMESVQDQSSTYEWSWKVPNTSSQQPVSLRMSCVIYEIVHTWPESYREGSFCPFSMECWVEYASLGYFR